jgi:hypothetical protein
MGSHSCTMPTGLVRYHHTGHFHFFTLSCYRRQQFFHSAYVPATSPEFHSRALDAPHTINEGAKRAVVRTAQDLQRLTRTQVQPSRSLPLSRTTSVTCGSNHRDIELDITSLTRVSPTKPGYIPRGDQSRCMASSLVTRSRVVKITAQRTARRVL